MSSENHTRLPRLHVDRENISRGEICGLSEGQHHYLRNVMRLQPGDRVRAFNGRNGEWLAEVTEISKKNAIISFAEKIREQTASPDVWALASPVKKEAFDFMIEKSSELGASQFFPILCDRTVVPRVNRERLQAISTEAAEQCERLDVMEVATLMDMESLFETWSSGRKLIFCLERGEAPPIAQALQQIPRKTPLAVLVGPEGGFSDAEIARIKSQPFAVPVSLGPRILKAETALLAALACVQQMTE
jgi:16S rRNA (uracil1498-N3)-methyltransferase